MSHDIGGDHRQIRIQLLGPVQAWCDGIEVALGSGQRKALLAVLALTAGQPLSRERLTAAIWGDYPPARSANVLQVHIAKLRQLLEPDRPGHGRSRILPAVGSGYALAIAPENVDAVVFRQALAAAAGARQAGDEQEVRRLLAPALKTWRPPLSDVAFFADQRIVTALAEDHWTAITWHAEATIACGAAAEVLPQLREAAAMRPLDEAIQALLIRALHAVGRRADAAAVYHEARRLLDDEMGLRPGPDLSDAYRLLITEPATVDEAEQPVGHPAPAQLPARVGYFTGRQCELTALRGLLVGPHDRMPVVCLHGAAGVGKTGLALELGHSVAREFIDGQLFVDLRGDDAATAMASSDVLVHLLRSIGADEARLPAGEQDRAAYWRTAVAGRRMLVVLDNAARAEQLLPLLPATTSSAVLVTSRSKLAALATYHDCYRHEVEPLSENEAVALLAGVLGDERLAAEPQAALALARFCGGLPLALRIAAAKLVTDPTLSLATAAENLQDERARLAALAVEGRSIRTVFASSYRSLPRIHARAWRLLAVHPGTSLSTDLIAAITNHTQHATRHLLVSLTGAHLLIDLGGDRYRMHDLLRLYAKELLSAREAEDALRQLFQWYLVVTAAASALVNPSHNLIKAPQSHWPMPFAEQSRDALDYLTDEAENLPVVVRAAALRGDDSAWRLVYFLYPFYLARNHPGDFIECARWGLRRAKDSEDRVALASMLNISGVAATIAHRMDEAIAHHRHQITVWQELADPAREASAWSNLGAAYSWLNRHRSALDSYQHALALATKANATTLAGIVLDNIGDTARDLGELSLSEQSLHRALHIWRDTGNDQGKGQALAGLGMTKILTGELELGVTLLRDAHRLHQAAGNDRMAAYCLRWIARTHAWATDAEAALQPAEQALILSRQIRDRHGESQALVTLGAIRLLRDDLSGAHHYLQQAQVLRAEVPDPLEEGILHHTIADLARRAGDHNRAEEHRAHAVRKLSEADCSTARAVLRAEHHAVLVPAQSPGSPSSVQ